MFHDAKQIQKARRLEKLINEARFTALGDCLHPEAPYTCDGDTVRGHSVQKALLEKIMDSNHKVYAPRICLVPADGPFQLSKIPVRNASIFHGFCESHDTHLFSAIENNSFEYAEEHTFLLAYRSISKELFNKKKIVDLKYRRFRVRVQH